MIGNGGPNDMMYCTSPIRRPPPPHTITAAGSSPEAMKVRLAAMVLQPPTRVQHANLVHNFLFACLFFFISFQMPIIAWCDFFFRFRTISIIFFNDYFEFFLLFFGTHDLLYVFVAHEFPILFFFLFLIPQFFTIGILYFFLLSFFFVRIFMYFV